ncbi:MAG: hypothetical protein MR877_10435 [Spirochaetia bacterium]|nr:hypothetical protein [Spirochaetia bacterium]
MIFDINGKTYSRIEFNSEEEVENVIINNFKLLFGDYSILLPKSMISTSGGKGTIPDGIIIDFDSKQWYIMEVERGIHGTWEHIAPQINKQITAIQNDDTKVKITENCIIEIQKNKNFIELLSEINISEINIHGEIEKILRKDPIVSLPIDYIPNDLEEWAENLKIKVEIQLVEKFSDKDGNVLFNMPDLEIKTSDEKIEKEIKEISDKKPENLLELVVKAGFLSDGEKVYMEYGPKGTKKKRFEGIVHINGIEVNGVISSPSISSLRCIQEVSPTRTTNNGWVTWKTMDGKVINDKWEKYQKSIIQK